MHPKLYDDCKQKWESVEASLEFEDLTEERELDVANYQSYGEHEQEANDKLVERIDKLIAELTKCKQTILDRYKDACCANCKHGYPEKRGTSILCEYWFDRYGGIDAKEPSETCYKWHAKEDY